MDVVGVGSVWVWVAVVGLPVVGLPGKGERAIREDEENGLNQAVECLVGSMEDEVTSGSGSSGNEVDQPGEGTGSSTHCRTSGDQIRVGRSRTSRAGVVWVSGGWVLASGVSVPPDGV